MEDASSHAARSAPRRLWLAGVLALTVLGGAAAIGAPMVTHVGRPHPAAPAAEAPRPVPTVRAERLVWEGADIDGDGQPDFANPTGKGLRDTDAYGCGAFGASRDHRSRRHEGVDFRADAGQSLVAPISGYVTKIGFAYPGDEILKFVEITNPALHYQARVFYIDPSVAVGQTVHLGQPIGRHHTLEQKYPGGMTDHVHLEIIDTHGARIDATQLITARWEPVGGAATG
jgi:murein DD-endopeptidase MepM/ murein hydrolase activator NlpD